jgi:hypothetical protein
LVGLYTDPYLVALFLLVQHIVMSQSTAHQIVSDILRLFATGQTDDGFVRLQDAFANHPDAAEQYLAQTDQPCVDTLLYVIGVRQPQNTSLLPACDCIYHLLTHHSQTDSHRYVAMQLVASDCFGKLLEILSTDGPLAPLSVAVLRAIFASVRAIGTLRPDLLPGGLSRDWSKLLALFPWTDRALRDDLADIFVCMSNGSAPREDHDHITGLAALICDAPSVARAVAKEIWLWHNQGFITADLSDLVRRLCVSLTVIEDLQVAELVLYCLETLALHPVVLDVIRHSEILDLGLVLENTRLPAASIISFLSPVLAGATPTDGCFGALVRSAIPVLLELALQPAPPPELRGLLDRAFSAALASNSPPPPAQLLVYRRIDAPSDRP